MSMIAFFRQPTGARGSTLRQNSRRLHSKELLTRGMELAGRGYVRKATVTMTGAGLDL